MSKISKLGLGVVAFEGVEHLQSILYELRLACDYICVCLQQKSYFGKPIKKSDVEEVNRLKSIGLIDCILWYSPKDILLSEDNTITQTRGIEVAKRNYILDFLENKIGCSHSLVIDSDEFYDANDFIRAKEYIDSSDEIKVTYCEYVNYYRDYRHIMLWPFYCYVPFITESHYRYSMTNGAFDKPSDPTRRYEMLPGEMYHILPFNMIKMHHFSWIRKNIEDKIDSWSAKKLFERNANLRPAILNRYYNYEDGQNAIIMFNVPFFEVIVQRLDKQYVNPKYPLKCVINYE